MSDIDHGLRAVSETTKRILKKRNAGKELSPEEIIFLDAAQGKVPVPVTPGAIPDKAATIARAVAILNAAGIAVTKPFLRQLKSEGVPGFEEKSGRVNLTLLVPQLKARLAAGPAAGGKPTKLDVEIRRLTAQARKVEAEANAIEDVSVLRAPVIESNRRVSSGLKKLLRKIEVEMPGELVGKDLAFIRQYGAALYDELCAEICRWEAEWPD